MIRTLTERVTLTDDGRDDEFLRVIEAYRARGFLIRNLDNLGVHYEAYRTLVIRPTPNPPAMPRIAA
ncbi:hypothetical protein N8I74_10920 [Chitiniphilus purpureus]|uniref:Uncharacterized protein n=1 Tax=Chitiniphilus purpureus TaxID=2981137 RepID=A0ABY6DHL2_9NEIS|nr:hypothetical protein [Chitiniphilus sp. CD1]UXY13834.1 hypothetical protein N8I74_10920 [Chitiniphilus sp. CD1]